MEKSMENPMEEKTVEILTVDRAVEIAEEIIGERPDYVYTNPNGERATPYNQMRCVNWDLNNDSPSCVVGHILFRHGVSKEKLIEKISASATAFDDRETVTTDAAFFLFDIQCEQDTGVPWGEALAKAKYTKTLRD
jgi:hypothetical protein